MDMCVHFHTGFGVSTPSSVAAEDGVEGEEAKRKRNDGSNGEKGCTVKSFSMHATEMKKQCKIQGYVKLPNENCVIRSE